MNIRISATIISSLLIAGDAFTATPSSATTASRANGRLFSTTNPDQAVETKVGTAEEVRTSDMDLDIADIFPMAETKQKAVPLTAEEINTRRHQQLEKMREIDQTSKQLQKEDLQIVHEDEDMVVVDKPSGVLTVAGKQPNANIAQSVFDALEVDLPTADHMVVHRLGFDTSGMLVFAKNKAAVRGMNTNFRTRKVKRVYEALVTGHIAKNEGLISLPIMRDYEFPPYVRISTDDHQRALLDLDPEDVGKKILEMPKASITKYKVVSREEFKGHPVTRVTLQSISGRYHQLNVHMAAFGHPIVGDKVYGFNGEAAPNGGLTNKELEELAPNPNRASEELKAAVAEASKDMHPCVHAKQIGFRHPVSKKYVEFSTDSPF